MRRPVPPHILSDFDAALDLLKAHIMMMALLTSQNLGRVRRGFLEDDHCLCDAAIADHEEIRALEAEIDRECTAFLTRFQPMVFDLRIVLAILKISVKLEHISDITSRIAGWTKEAGLVREMTGCRGFESVLSDVCEFFADAMAAFDREDEPLLLALETREHEIVGRSIDVAEEIKTLMAYEIGEGVKGCMQGISIVRNLEQIARCSSRILEDAWGAFARA